MTASLRVKVGQRIAGDLSVLGKIKAHSDDPVYLVWNHQAWCPMACKFFGSPRRARREAAALSSLSHPNIVRCLGHRDANYVLMEFLEGPTLSKLIAQQPQGRLPVSDALRVAIHLGAALQHIHSRGFLYMDMKPDNVIIVHGRPVLFDFGSVRVKSDPRPDKIDGTDPYMAPEECLMQPVDESADVFSLGATLYEMLTGELPFAGEKRRGLLPQARRPATPLRRHRPRINTGLERWVMQCLDRDPRRRPSLSVLLPALHSLINRGPAMWPADLKPAAAA